MEPTRKDVGPAQNTEPQVPGAIAETIGQNAEAFSTALFPQTLPANISDTESFQYSQQIEFPPMTAQEIEEAVRGAKAGKAPGEDDLTIAL